MTDRSSPRAKSTPVSKHQPKSTPEGEALIDRFVKHRKAKGWTQDEAAKRLEISVWSLRAYERKARTPNGPATLKILNLLGALK